MVRKRHCSYRSVVMVMVGGVLAVTFFINRYVLTTIEHKRREDLRMRVQRLRLESLEGGKEEGGQSHSNASLPSTKVILMHSFPSYYELKSGSHVFSQCTRPCTLTLDKELLEEVDCVVFYTHAFRGPVPPRLPHQLWVYFAVESPLHSQNAVFGTPEWHDRFNWTMTYRRDSDFYFGYGDFLKPSQPLPRRNFSSLVAGKSKMVAWFVSNCQSQSNRGEFVTALKEFITVDVYGQCGTLECNRNDPEVCKKMLSRDYYFYLSFENSLCKDYITEKAYNIMRDVDIIPVVRGGANYSALLPKKSFIDASAFPTIKALAEYMKKVAGDRQLYESYLSWKNEWQVIEPIPFHFCEYCERVHQPDRWARVYHNVDSWWREGICHNPPSVVKT